MVPTGGPKHGRASEAGSGRREDGDSHLGDCLRQLAITLLGNDLRRYAVGRSRLARWVSPACPWRMILFPVFIRQVCPNLRCFFFYGLSRAVLGGWT